jgi:hypothetical protein
MSVEITYGRCTLSQLDDMPVDKIYPILIILLKALMIFAFVIEALMGASEECRPLNTAVTIREKDHQHAHFFSLIYFN